MRQQFTHQEKCRNIRFRLRKGARKLAYLNYAILNANQDRKFRVNESYRIWNMADIQSGERISKLHCCIVVKRTLRLRKSMPPCNLVSAARILLTQQYTTPYVHFYLYVGELKKERRDFQKKKNSNFDVRTSVCRSRELCSKVFRCQCQCFVGFYQTKNKRRYITSNIEVLFKTL